MRPPVRATGPPRLDPERLVPDLPQDPDRLWARLYIRGVDDDLEKLHGFRPGDTILSICKLSFTMASTASFINSATAGMRRFGSAGTSTPIHLHTSLLRFLSPARRKKTAAVDKVPVGQHLCLPLKQFVSQSPNGTHIGLVYPVLGPVARDAANIFDGRLSAIEILQEISRQAVSGSTALHSHGICHGGMADFRPSNVLLELQGLDGLGEEQVLALLGEPETTDIHIRKDSHPTPEMPHAPNYLLYPVDFRDVSLSVISPRAQVIDCGQSFDTSQGPPPAAFGIPANYAAPEVVLDSSGSTAMDLWSLGCTLYEIRLGQRLFDVFQLLALSKKSYMDEIASLLGEPPEPWTKYYSESDDKSDTSATPSSPSSGDDGDTCIDAQVERARSIQEKLASCHDCTGEQCAHPRFQVILEAEATILTDLLERLLRYPPEERLSAQDVLKHAWFHTRY